MRLSRTIPDNALNTSTPTTCSSHRRPASFHLMREPMLVREVSIDGLLLKPGERHRRIIWAARDSSCKRVPFNVSPDPKLGHGLLLKMTFATGPTCRQFTASRPSHSMHMNCPITIIAPAVRHDSHERRTLRHVSSFQSRSAQLSDLPLSSLQRDSALTSVVKVMLRALCRRCCCRCKHRHDAIYKRLPYPQIAVRQIVLLSASEAFPAFVLRLAEFTASRSCSSSLVQSSQLPSSSRDPTPVRATTTGPRIRRRRQYHNRANSSGLALLLQPPPSSRSRIPTSMKRPFRSCVLHRR